MPQGEYLDEGGAVYNVRAYGVEAGNHGADNYTQLHDLLTNTIFNAGGGIAWFPGNVDQYEIAGNITVPYGVTLRFAQGARLKLFSNQPYQLTVDGDIDAGPYPIVGDIEENPTPIVFGAGTFREVYPEWFGAQAGSVYGLDLDGDWGDDADNIAVDSTGAIQAAVASLPHTGGLVRFLPGQYKISDEILIEKSGVLFVGGVRQGPANPLSPQHGSYLTFVDPPWAMGSTDCLVGKCMLRFAMPTEYQDEVTAQEQADNPLISWGGGVRGLSFVSYGRRSWADLILWGFPALGYLPHDNLSRA